MTEYRAPAEPYATTFEAAATAVDGREVVLSETYFYAEGGGQPADRGTLDGVEVVDVQHGEDGVVHVLAEEPGFAAGATVTGDVDDEFRTYCMRAHTASHALYGAGRRELSELGYGGFDIDDEKVRVDFETTTDVDDDVLVALERHVNRVVWESRVVTWEQVDRDDALARDDVAFNAATEEGVSDYDTVRVVEIDGWDAAACGGTHVENTREIGPVTVLGRSNPGEGLTRVEFAVGPVAVERRAAEKRAASRAARALDASVTDVGDAAERAAADLADLQADLDALEAEVLGARVADLPAVERDGATWRVGTVDGFGPNAVGEHAQEVAGDAADVVAVAGRDGAAFLVVATTGDVDAGEVVADATDEFGGGGGGSPTFAQGGGMSADPADVAEYVAEGEAGE
jgi:alanyl-tRNA synthetase